MKFSRNIYIFRNFEKLMDEKDVIIQDKLIFSSLSCLKIPRITKISFLLSALLP